MNNLFIIVGAVLIGIGVIQKPNKKELTSNSDSDTVQTSNTNANSVPKPNETETHSDINDDSGISDSGDAV